MIPCTSLEKNMSESIECPQCKSPYAYPSGSLMVCPDCNHEWNASDVETVIGLVVKDANGTVLSNGDSVIVLKSLPMKGSNQPLKAGTKIKNIRLIDGDHNIACRVDTFGAIFLKSEFLRKV